MAPDDFTGLSLRVKIREKMLQYIPAKNRQLLVFYFIYNCECGAGYCSSIWRYLYNQVCIVAFSPVFLHVTTNR